MRNWRRAGKWVLGVSGAIVLLLALLLWTPPGLALAGRLLRPLSGGMVAVEGLGGTFPGDLHAETVTVSDARGAWLRVTKVSVRWSALALLRSHVAVQDVTAARITVLRRPVSQSESGSEGPRIDIDHLSFPHIDIAAPVIGNPAALTASGALHYISRHQLAADLTVARLGNSDSYRIAGGIEQDVAHGTAAVREGADGILGRLVGLPGLGPVNLSARASGTEAANALSFTLTAGPLNASGRGVIRLGARQADLDISATAPAMAPRPDIAWQSLAADGHIHGDFDAPNVQVHLRLGGGKFAGLAAAEIALAVTGNAGTADLNGTASGVMLPGTYAGLFAEAPMTFTAHADLKAASRPLAFAIAHPLVSVRGTAHASGSQSAAADITIPSLAPFAALQQIDLRGGANLHIALEQSGRQTKLSLNGKMDAQGTSIPARLLGRNAALDFRAIVEDSDVTSSDIRLQGAGIAANVSGNFRKGVLGYRLSLAVPDLSLLTDTLRGSLSLQGGANGPLKTASLTAGGEAMLATGGFARQRIAIAMQATGLPAPQNAQLTADGNFDGAPLALHAGLRGGESRQISMTARWKSLDAKADIALRANTAASGTARVTLKRLEDIAVFTGNPITGAADTAIDFEAHGAKTDATVQVALKNIHWNAIAAQTVSAHGNVADLFGKPVLGIAATAQDLESQGFQGGAEAQMDGPLDSLAIKLTSGLKDDTGASARLTAAALLDITRRHLAVTKLDGDWRGAALNLEAPATIDFADGLAVDRLAVRLGGGEVTAKGRISPKLALNLSARDIALGNFQAFLPQIGVQGTLSANATLSGTLAAPQGTLALQGRGLRAAFSGGGAPAAGVDLHAQLLGDHATLTAAVTAGPSSHLNLSGDAPLAAGKTMELHAGGSIDLALLDPILAVDGRRARGTLAFNGDIGGSFAAPRISGSAKLGGGEIQDYARGARVDNMTAVIQAEGARIRVTQFTGHAGPGTLSGSGSIDLAGPGTPVDFTLTAKDARPIASDLLTATLSGDLNLAGTLSGGLNLSGKMQVTGGEINLPEHLPPQVALLNVRRRGQPPPPPPSRSNRIALDVAVRTSGPIFVRGQGMDAEMAGAIHLGGSSDVPDIAGGFQMNRGSYSVAGQTLDFTSGRIGFDGTSVRGRLDPSLNFVAQSVSGGTTATLTVSGYASAPKISLSSAPQLPQDEVVAHLLFQQSVKQLTPLQLASIAQALAAMGGVGGGFNPLGSVRKTLGLDRLTVGSTTGGASGSESQTTLEAGRYVARNVYVGVKQNLSGGTQTQVQVDITRRFKAQATVSTGTDATSTKGNAQQDNGSSVGFAYQFEY